MNDSLALPTALPTFSYLDFPLASFLEEAFIEPSRGILTLIPIPLWPETPIEPVAGKMLLRKSQDPKVKLVVENAKVARAFLKSFGVSRDFFSQAIEFNMRNKSEHALLMDQWIKWLGEGGEIFLMSDGGLAGFCDPGLELINQCHQHQIKVRATPFFNSALLALVLSGFKSEPFHFVGFLPQRDDLRVSQLRLFKDHSYYRGQSLVLMETPYRFKKMWQELKDFFADREIFLMTNIGSGSQEKYWRGFPLDIDKVLDFEKGEFVVVINRKEL